MISNQNTSSGDPPFDPPFPFLENTISQLSQEKKSSKNIKNSSFYAKFSKKSENEPKTWTVMSGRVAKISDKKCFFELSKKSKNGRQSTKIYSHR